MKAYLLAVLTIAVLGNVKAFESKLINGTIVDKAAYPAIVRLRESGSEKHRCTATIVGKRAIITAAHCADEGEELEFDVNGTTYQAVAHPSELFKPDDELNPSDHDIAILIATTDIAGVRPYSIQGKAYINSQIQIFGYGCYAYSFDPINGGASFDGNLRTGYSTVTNFEGYDMVSKYGAALCFGDSGGPAFVNSLYGGLIIVGINSKGDIATINYNTRTDSETSQNYFQKIINEYNVDICGININC